MDELVKQALAKWPNVPHCYGWLGLDARGHWRMRDQQAQQQQLPGDKIAHAALLGFINRNYAQDDRGCWFFQNGPQRVFVELETAPWVWRLSPNGSVRSQDGRPAGVQAVLVDEPGRVFLRTDRGMGLAAAIAGGLAGAALLLAASAWLRVDRAGARLFKDETEIRLTSREWALFDALLSARGRVLSKQALEDRLYAFDDAIEGNAVEVYVSRLRGKLGADAIQTRRGLGYLIP